nr:MAG TPA: tail-collar fiber protein [Caudoviricetes sp.]
MAKYPDLITTKKGLDLNSAANAAQKAVIFTKVVAGDGDVPSETSISDLTAVVSPKMKLEITNKENLGNGHFTIRSVLGNENLENGFYAKEIGVYAKLDGDVEVLYAYTNGGNYVDYIPDKSSPIDAQVFNIDVIIGNLQQATILINDETHVTVQDLEEHNTNENAHANLALLINDALAPTADKNTLVNLLSNIANMLTQITGKDDWKAGPAASIATILSNLQGSLAVNWDGDKFTVPALGVSGLMAQNGYINFGKLFGGLIVQWGLTETNEYGTAWVSFPISFKIPIPIVVAIHNGLDAVSAYISSDNRNAQQTAIVLRKIVDNSQQSGWGVGWIAIGF